MEMEYFNGKDVKHKPWNRARNMSVVLDINVGTTATITITYNQHHSRH